MTVTKPQRGFARSLRVKVDMKFPVKGSLNENSFIEILKDAGQAEEIREESLAPYLAMSYAPEPDLFIRTGGEQRISNFLLWQLAYTELYFTDTLWPDFDAAALDAAIDSYRSRERRFGRTSEQVEQSKRAEVA